MNNIKQELSQAKEDFYRHVLDLQDQISNSLKFFDPELKLTEDIWERQDFNKNPGGGGRTRAFEGGVIENAGVNVSRIFGDVDPKFADKLQGSGESMFACGISLIIHPRNPKVPTVHANFRMIERGNKFWFGGGADLTPFYPNIEDFKYFHDVWIKACGPFNCYDWMKKECDEYFVNFHRNNEMRGIGGIFFDHFNSDSLNNDLKMVKHLSNHFIESYFPIVEKRKDESFTDEDVDFQLHRRGRYVEFNLLHDRGTTFGLKTNGRVDSILISLPKRANFTYKYLPKKNSPHEKMMEYYFPKSWK
jgi:coproporphyrinogen III oxidase